MICIMGCHKYSQVVVLFSAGLSLKMCSSQGIFCEYMIRGTTAPVFNLTLALRNVTDSNHPTPPHSSPSSTPTITTTAGYKDHPIHTAAQRHISGCLEGYFFILTFMTKKKNHQIFTKACHNHLILKCH